MLAGRSTRVLQVGTKRICCCGLFVVSRRYASYKPNKARILRDQWETLARCSVQSKHRSYLFVAVTTLLPWQYHNITVVLRSYDNNTAQSMIDSVVNYMLGKKELNHRPE